MIRRLIPALVVLAVVAAPALADNKLDAKKLKGTWAHEVNGNKLAFKFKDEKTMQALLTPQGADKPIVVDVDYSIDKDGVLSGVISKVEGGGDGGGPAKGDKFSFKIELGKEKLVISDLKGVGDDNTKQIVEGEYKKQAD